MPKFKFTNSDAEQAAGVTALACKNYEDQSHDTNDSLATIKYRFDKDSGMFLELTIESQWFRTGDIDELIAFLKAAKKRGAKLQARQEASL